MTEINKQIEINIPSTVNWILSMLNASGYEAYIVGGCVRDALMHVPPHDWDICTSALPEEIMEVFKSYKIIPTGLKHGTVTVMLNSEPFEITTYRIDGEYEDNRRPKDVIFTKSLKQDLSRRDFTINAMAYNPQIGIVDIFNGMKDIELRIIRCVGNAEERFSEDALRILRAMRFAATLDFYIDLPTACAMDKCKDLLCNISGERISSELTKMLKAEKRSLAFTLTYCTKCFLPIIPEMEEVIDEHWIPIIYESKNFLNTRIALFFDMPEDKLKDVMTRLKFCNAIIYSVINTRQYGQELLNDIESCEDLQYFAKSMMNKIGHTDTLNAVYYALAHIEHNRDYNAREKLFTFFEFANKAFNQHECYQLSTLGVNGNDIASAGFKGKKIGIILDYLLHMVMRGILRNNREELLQRLESLDGMQEMS